MAIFFLTRCCCFCAMLILSLTQSSCSEKISPPARSATSSAPVSLDKLEDEILAFVNEYRGGKGLPALEMQASISAEAKTHSLAMAKGSTDFGHGGFENRVKSIGQKLGALASSAENVAYGDLTARQVVDGWLKSPGHRKNIEGNYNLSGIGTARRSDGVIFFTQIFVRK